ncbi:NUDIX hydrolase [Serpentinicella alkaliphila]|uniref:8-oxo-dGTP diphosphatase n=1 Tax=Serpentinicella alkaliphila TaxID=1734049 RepID=A0A4R2T3R3_9FIRM|nr:NUDIX domain-containing protein [Serpentinicella alkaliphila]QUH26360.1 NUDIX domain-containing protein [Serpentinicella alkaliphila]TCP97617.1 8-oxo-dGTP diphosphatase [Serpentinicella alkaliphila]
MLVKIYELGEIEDNKLEFAAISALYMNKYVFVKHKKRETWEIPGGRREKGETICETGKRELQEETGAEEFEIEEICDYSVTIADKTTYGRLFYSNIYKLGELPDLEIGEVELFDSVPNKLTYPKIQPLLQKKAIEMCNKLKLKE